MKQLNCATLIANLAKKVEVESAFVRALPGFSIVGLPSQSIQESKDRIKSALLKIGFKFPAQKITINLSPSDLKKEGSHFDLAIAVLIALQNVEFDLGETYVFGELGLDGSVKSTQTLFSLLLALATTKKNVKVLIPYSIAKRASTIPNLTVYGVNSLEEAISFFIDKDKKEEFLHTEKDPLFKNPLIIEEKTYVVNSDYPLDFKDIKGQSRAKRAMMIASAGFHNVLLEGSPGCGKSMSIKRLRYILPPLNTKEVLESAAHRSLGEKEVGFEAVRAFRSPHHTSSKPSIFGGGSSSAKIGEVALAHNGILFFDEFPHYSRQVLESLREPLEDGQVLISRVNMKVLYPTKILFAAAMNPCPCGYSLSLQIPCKCSEAEIVRYRSKISGPLLERIDLHIQMDESKDSDEGLDSKTMHQIVLNAFKKQKKRGQIEFNAKLQKDEMERFCICTKEALEILNEAASRFGLSYRVMDKSLKIARTIADIENSDKIESSHIIEALSYRLRH
ncbi:MAG: YifB family Mg chelatase-like AAA ATPase [Sulfurospirillaceae bacterium]|jgi:magnesium chelatase family protein|nr:YifB family Mg chelatase-like AAA ATPase [Sulfurospirillaceae bacterium]MCK9545100.1 YifB family Mg chelatase-like AAA ATPase [Sulfurospirillaceae bacterium]MDY0238285.1 YifB family Mg chelatase-like AAA ATPase [Campylobacterales bacterium]NLM99908.1 YifB family Mg chelatase-like AAA ATPase [Campylobacteraceae bacterium]